MQTGFSTSFESAPGSGTSIVLVTMSLPVRSGPICFTGRPSIVITPSASMFSAPRDLIVMCVLVITIVFRGRPL